MFYTHSTMDRADHLRKDVEALDTLRRQPDALLVLVWKGQSLVADTENAAQPQALFLPSHSKTPEGQSVFLGFEGSRPFFAIDVSVLDETQAMRLVDKAQDRQGNAVPGSFLELRVAGPLLSDQDGALLAYARGLIYWNQNTRHCLHCGSTLASGNGGHVRQCVNTACNYLVFPRTDPAVIMLVSHDPGDNTEPRCLLGRSPGWPAGVYSTLAGFVEPGETLEAAVQREVKEEASIDTTDVRYVASQPWPFPRSIMLGFEAKATSTDIQCDPTELEDAKWFTRDQLKTFGQWGDDAPGYKLPRKDSISRFLIERWIAGTTD